MKKQIEIKRYGPQTGRKCKQTFVYETDAEHVPMPPPYGGGIGTCSAHHLDLYDQSFLL